MLARAVTHALVGLEPRRVEVEAHVHDGVPAFAIVGLPDRAMDVQLHLAGQDVQARAVSATGLVRSMPRQQVRLSLTLSGPGAFDPDVDGGVDLGEVDGDDTAGSIDDLALPPCQNGVRDGAETDVDCGGGTCPPCATGKACLVDADCASGGCDVVTMSCVADQCADHHRDGAETDIDCGGACPPCAVTEGCLVGADCVQVDEAGPVVDTLLDVDAGDREFDELGDDGH